MELYREIGQRLRARRDELHMSQADLARAAGLHRSSVANIEAGRQRIALDDLVLLARALKVDYRNWLPEPASLEIDIALPSDTQIGKQTSDFLSRHGMLRDTKDTDDPA